jgi:hypothetical protein
MAAPRAFTSFDYDHDATSQVLFCGQADKDSPTPFTVANWSQPTELPQAEWEALNKARINNCHMLIVLVGKFMASATGVAKEIQMAKDQDVPVFGVYVNGGDSNSVLPAGLQRNRTVTWTWANVAACVDQMMTEGKNAK